MNWFMVVILVLNVCSSLTFLCRRNWPWAMIYAGAAPIQVGSIWAANRA